MATSRYRNSNIINESGTPRYLETFNFPEKKDLDSVSTFKIRISQFDRLDQLAYKYLGDGTYWWVIALINDIDWMYDLTAGAIIKIPINVQDVLRLL